MLGCWIIQGHTLNNLPQCQNFVYFFLLLNHPGTDCDQIYFQPISHCYRKKKTSLVANTASSFLMTTNFTLLLTFYLVIQNKIKPYYQGKSIDCAASLYLLLLLKQNKKIWHMLAFICRDISFHMLYVHCHFIVSLN